MSALENKIGNTIIFFSSDNGGAVNNGGYNYPLRGDKGSLFDGGAKQVSFMYAGDYIQVKPAVGSTFAGILHVADIFTTFYRLGFKGTLGTEIVEETWFDYTNIQYKDGIDFWEELSYNYASPREEVPIWVGGDEGAIRMNSDAIAGDYKLVLNGENDGWYPAPSTLRSLPSSSQIIG